MIHEPVLLSEIMQFFSEVNPPVKNYLDGTFGRGGHTRAMFQEFANLEAHVFDRDRQAIEYGKEHFSEQMESKKIFFWHHAFSEFKEVVDEPIKENFFDAILLDLGVSSPQLDQGERGFSFQQEGPLDMRMDQRQDVDAAQLLNESSEDELFEIFSEYGEVRRPGKVIRAVVHDRKENAFETTRQLAGLIERVDGWRQRGVHPATKYFMALRLVVNRELGQVKDALPDLMRALRPGGRIAVITFHSLEDRIVKNIFKDGMGLGKVVNKKVVQPKWDEKKKNPRARSAKLRVFERGEREQ